MPSALRPALIGAFMLAPAAALAQGLVMSAPAEEILVIEEPVIVQEPAVMGVPVGPGPLTEEDAVAIAMMHGMVTVEDVDSRMWDGNFEVEGLDASGNDLEITIDGQTGAVLEIDD